MSGYGASPQLDDVQALEVLGHAVGKHGEVWHKVGAGDDVEVQLAELAPARSGTRQEPQRVPAVTSWTPLSEQGPAPWLWPCQVLVHLVPFQLRASVLSTEEVLV